MECRSLDPVIDDLLPIHRESVRVTSTNETRVELRPTFVLILLPSRFLPFVVSLVTNIPKVVLSLPNVMLKRARTRFLIRITLAQLFYALARKMILQWRPIFRHQLHTVDGFPQMFRTVHIVGSVELWENKHIFSAISDLFRHLLFSQTKAFHRHVPVHVSFSVVVDQVAVVVVASSHTDFDAAEV